MIKPLILLTAVRQSEYDDHQARQSLGIYSSEEKVLEAIDAYESRMRQIDCEVLLDDTKYERKTHTLDDLPYSTKPRTPNG